MGTNPGAGIGLNDEATRPSAMSKSNVISHNLIANRKYGIGLNAGHEGSVVENSHIFNNIIVNCQKNFNVTTSDFKNSSITNNISIIENEDIGSHYNGPSETPSLFWGANLWTSEPFGPASGYNDVVKKLDLNNVNGWSIVDPSTVKGAYFVPKEIINSKNNFAGINSDESETVTLLSQAKLKSSYISPASVWPLMVLEDKSTSSEDVFGAFMLQNSTNYKIDPPTLRIAPD
jgi:hypothetical protein